MKNNKRFIIGAVAAMLTFGGLKAIVGKHFWANKHHQSHCEHHHRCGEHGNFSQKLFKTP